MTIALAAHRIDDALRRFDDVLAREHRGVAGDGVFAEEPLVRHPLVGRLGLDDGELVLLAVHLLPGAFGLTIE